MVMNASKIPHLTRLIPDKGPATITLSPDTTPIVVNVFNAWFMQDRGGLRGYGMTQVQSPKTIIKFLDSEFNAAGLGYEVRARDVILFRGILYRVQMNDGNLTTMRTTWECNVEKEIL